MERMADDYSGQPLSFTLPKGVFSYNGDTLATEIGRAMTSKYIISKRSEKGVYVATPRDDPDSHPETRSVEKLKARVEKETGHYAVVERLGAGYVIRLVFCTDALRWTLGKTKHALSIACLYLLFLLAQSLQK